MSERLPPYDITITPSSGNVITPTDVSNAIANYTQFYTARYMFIQIEATAQVMHYSSIQIYDPQGNLISGGLPDNNYAQSSTYANISWFRAKYAFNTGYTNYNHTGYSSGTREWIGVNLGSDKQIGGIRVYTRPLDIGVTGDNYYLPNGDQYDRMAPFRIYLYKNAEYINGHFYNGGLGPINYDTYHLRSHSNKIGPSYALIESFPVSSQTITDDSREMQGFYYGINLIHSDWNSDIETNNYVRPEYTISPMVNNNAIITPEYRERKYGNYFNMDVSMDYPEMQYGVYLPTVTFTNTSSNGLFTKEMRIAQLEEQGFSGFYEADFDNDIRVIDVGAFQDDDKLCVATINRVTDICGNAFKGCSNLRSVTLDTSVHTENTVSLRYIFIELQTENEYMNYAEIEVYDDNGDKIPIVSVVQSSIHGGIPGSQAIDGDYNNFHHTSASANFKSWIGINLGADKQVSYMKVYSRDGYPNWGNTRTAPFNVYGYSFIDYFNTTNNFNDTAYHSFANPTVSKTSNDSNYSKSVDQYLTYTLSVFTILMNGDLPNIYKINNIHESAFENCTALTNLFIPETVTSIAPGLCKGCTNLEVAVMGYGVSRGVFAYIGDNAFQNCSSLKYFVIPDTVNGIGHNAFDGCSGLTDILLSEYTQSLGTNVFANIGTGCKLKLPENGSQQHTFFPDASFNNITIERYKVVTITNAEVSQAVVNSAFAANVNDYNKLWKVRITNAWKVHENAFRNYQKIVAISIPRTLIYWYHAAIYMDTGNVSQLMSLYIPRTLHVQSTYAFARAQRYDTAPHNDKQIVFESYGRTTNITTRLQDVTNRENTFLNNPIKALILPVSFNRSTNNMCRDCNELQFVNIFQKNAATSYAYMSGGLYDFAGCYKMMTEIHLTKLKYLTIDMFSYSTALRRVFIYNPEIMGMTLDAYNTSSYDNYRNYFYVYDAILNNNGTDMVPPPKSDFTFLNTAYVHLVFKKNITYLAADKFQNIWNLRTITFEHQPDKTSTADMQIDKQVFYDCTRLHDGANYVKWNNRRLYFNGQYVFAECSRMFSFNMPNIVTNDNKIPHHMLEGCVRLKHVYWGYANSVVTHINYNILARCSAIKTMVIPKSVYFIYNNAFRACTFENIIFTRKNVHFESAAALNASWAPYADGLITTPNTSVHAPNNYRFFIYPQANIAFQTVKLELTNDFHRFYENPDLLTNLFSYGYIYTMVITSNPSNPSDKFHYPLIAFEGGLYHVFRSILYDQLMALSVAGMSTKQFSLQYKHAYPNSGDNLLAKTWMSMGPIGYEIDGRDIGILLAPSYKMFHASPNYTHRIRINPRCTRFAFLIIGGGQGGANGNAQSGGGAAGGKAGNSGAIKFVGFDKSRTPGLDAAKCEIVVANGGAGSPARTTNGGSSEGVHATPTYVKVINNTNKQTIYQHYENSANERPHGEWVNIRTWINAQGQLTYSSQGAIGVNMIETLLQNTYNWKFFIWTGWGKGGDGGRGDFPTDYGTGGSNGNEGVVVLFEYFT